MRWALVMVGVVSCYSPQAPLGVPCDDLVGCPAGQVCVFHGGGRVCQPAGSVDDPDGGVIDPDGPVPDGIPADWWDAAWKRRRSIDITVGATATPGDYSFAVTFDHAAVVAAGHSKASGDDVRIVRDDGVEMNRVIDTGSDFNTPSTTLWFADPDPLAASATQRFWLYYDNPAAGAAPASPGATFLLFDDFEGTLAKWDVDPAIEQTTTRAHRGSKAVFVTTPQNQTGVSITAKNLDVRDVAIDAWWNIDDLTSADMSQWVRGNATSVYFTDLQLPGPTWDISKVVNGTYSELVPPPSGADVPPANTWFRVTVYAHRRSMAVDVGGARYVPTSGFSTVDADPSGDVGLDGYIVASHVWWDDVIVRRFVNPEPTVTLGAEQSL